MTRIHSLAFAAFGDVRTYKLLANVADIPNV